MMLGGPELSRQGLPVGVPAERDDPLRAELARRRPEPLHAILRPQFSCEPASPAYQPVARMFAN